VRLLDSAASGSDTFSKIHVSFQTHGNAIIDLAFSEDDGLLATASGDRTGRVMDMMTQTPISVLDHHTASLKQVRFQPGRGGGHVLATSGRDGSIRVWDLRCRASIVQDFVVEPRQAHLGYALPRKMTQGGVINSIFDAHARTLRQGRQQGAGPTTTTATSQDVGTRGEVPGRIGEVSVTALQFLPAGREHLLLSACEADASIKLWDIRNVHMARHKAGVPVSVASEPGAHAQWRPFGISSMSLSGDGARLYAVCKDNTVYVYATSHLVLGHAPELARRRGEDAAPRRRNAAAQEGLGPLYGLRHDKFHATSFYVKSAVRPARDGRPEMLAVGSSDGCAILFPTDERYLDRDNSQYHQHRALGIRDAAAAPAATLTSTIITRSHHHQQQQRHRPTPSRTNSFSQRVADTIPIHRLGTPLVRGHDKEIGALTWTRDGRLVTLGDDYLVRRWSEDRGRAADLRTGGEGQGRRWGCGWADVGESWDGDDDDEW